MILPSSFFDSNPYFGISLGRSSIKAVSVNADHSIASYAGQPINGISLDQPAAYSQELATSLQKIITQGRFTSPYVAVVLPETYAFSKEFSLPTGNLAEFEEAISWQIGDLFPFASEGIYTDWKLLHQTKDSITALLVAIPKNRIDPIRTALAKAKLFPVSFEPAISALSRISSLKNRPITILVDINQADHSVSLIENGISLLTTTNSIIKDSPDVVSHLIKSIRELLVFYQSKSNIAPDQFEIVLSGDQANDVIAQNLTHTFNQPASILHIDSINPGFHQAYAAAASQISPPEDRHTINLLPSDLRLWYQTHYQLSLLKRSAGFLAAFLIMGFLLTLGNGLYLTLQSNNLTLPVSPAIQSNPDLPYRPSDIVSKANRIITLFPQKSGPQEEILAAITALPASVKIESFGYDDSKHLYQFTGSALSRDDILLLKSNLENTGLFSEVALPIGALTTKTNVNFTIEFTGQPGKTP